MYDHIDSGMDIRIVTSTKKFNAILIYYHFFFNLEYHGAILLEFYASGILSCSMGCQNVGRGRHFCG
jgi:hypothetical protein